MVTMAVCSDNNPFGIEEDVICGCPVICENGKWRFAEKVEISEKVRTNIDVTVGTFHI